MRRREGHVGQLLASRRWRRPSPAATASAPRRRSSRARRSRSGRRPGRRAPRRRARARPRGRRSSRRRSGRRPRVPSSDVRSAPRLVARRVIAAAPRPRRRRAPTGAGSSGGRARRTRAPRRGRARARRPPAPGARRAARRRPGRPSTRCVVANSSPARGRPRAATRSRKPRVDLAAQDRALVQAGQVDAVQREVLAHVADEVRELEGDAEVRDVLVDGRRRAEQRRHDPPHRRRR